ncbi:MAG: IS1096 element passenger TnpR family protein [Thermaurantimonas sp.]|uniref:IS1096 element passenger TnpR family protein n=1 Tax=Thermaurantimonas sp. TaxID=2681568 RepID=UPI00391B95CB
MENFTFLVTLDDDKSDVIREIGIESNKTLEDLHHLIVSSFGLPPGELASFYRTNENWEQLDEIPLLPLGEGENAPLPMREISVGAYFTNNNRLLYVYDFLNLWTFYVVKKSQGPALPVGLIHSIGVLPPEAPARFFTGESNKDKKSSFDDDFAFSNDEDEFFDDEDFGEGFHEIDPDDY